MHKTYSAKAAQLLPGIAAQQQTQARYYVAKQVFGYSAAPLTKGTRFASNQCTRGPLHIWPMGTHYLTPNAHGHGCHWAKSQTAAVAWPLPLAQAMAAAYGGQPVKAQ